MCHMGYNSGKNPRLQGKMGEAVSCIIFNEAKGVKLSDADLWFKLGLTLYDGKYYQEAFLISGNRQILSKMRKLKEIIKPRHIPQDLKTRLINIIDSFRKDATRRP